ncbi:MAG: radical SAM protein [uncultured bacterium]|nr:MAG: radical SAM protein [uncultured bacterium]
MQGGLHPDHTLDTYIELVNHIKQNHPIHIHAFSPPEIHHVATKAQLSYKDTLLKLKEAGLASMPGGGAEILVDEIRDPIAVGKCSVDEWLEIMRQSHLVGIKSTATMMLGHIESWEDRLLHLQKIRDLQDETKGFISFIPWTFQPENTPLHPNIKRNKNVHLASAFEYLRFLAISRLFLDNFDHIQVSLLTQGAKVAQIGLYYGSDDLGSLLIEENVVRLAGRNQEAHLEREKMVSLISEAGLTPFERDTYYHEINPQYSTKAKVVGM